MTDLMIALEAKWHELRRHVGTRLRSFQAQLKSKFAQFKAKLAALALRGFINIFRA